MVLFEKFTDQARRAVVLASDAARTPRLSRHRTPPARSHRQQVIGRRTDLRRSRAREFGQAAGTRSSSGRRRPREPAGPGPTHITTVRLTDAEHTLCAGVGPPRRANASTDGCATASSTPHAPDAPPGKPIPNRTGDAPPSKSDSALRAHFAPLRRSNRQSPQVE